MNTELAPHGVADILGRSFAVPVLGAQSIDEEGDGFVEIGNRDPEMVDCLERRNWIREPCGPFSMARACSSASSFVT